ncbi:MAG: hypothetical protein ACR2FH_02030 [Caulobacteraceae bacterium]
MAKLGGVPTRDILDPVMPMAEARYAVFHSFSGGADGGGYYDVHPIHNAPRPDPPRLWYEWGAGQCASRRAAPPAL